MSSVLPAGTSKEDYDPLLLQFVSLLLLIHREIIDLSQETSAARILAVFVSSRRADWLLGGDGRMP